MGRDDRVEFVRVEPMLGDKRGFWGCVEREVAGAAMDGLGRARVSGLNKRMGREIFSGPGRVFAGSGEVNL